MRSFDKKGSSHLEMVFAFTIFIVFTIFLLFYLKAPVDTSVPDVILEELSTSFYNYTSTELVSFVVKPNSTNCTNFDLSNYSLKGNSFVRDFNGERWGMSGGFLKKLSTGILNSSFFGKTLMINSSSTEPLQVFISEEFITGTETCVNASNLTVGSMTRKQVLSANKSANFQTEYFADYDTLRQKLHLPSDVDFAINATGLIVADKGSPSGVDVKTKYEVHEAVFPDGTVKKIGVLFKIW